MAHYFITGGCGFLGTWIIRRLLDDGDRATIFDLSLNTKRWEMILSRSEIEAIKGFYGVPVEDGNTVKALLRSVAPDAIIHLSALQVPACRTDPIRGALVNVLGTLNVFEAVRELAAAGAVKPAIVYASSAAVFGPGAEYGEAVVGDQSMPKPSTHYGAFKLCNEHCARAYWLEHGISSAGLRPLTVYGPGRDIGMTSFPTRAIAAAVKKQRFEIPFNGPTAYIHAREVAAIFVACARKQRADASVYTVGGDVTDTAGFVSALDEVLPGSRDLISFSGGGLPIAARLDDSALRRDYPNLSRISLSQGIRETVEIFQKLEAAGKLEV